MDGLVGRVLEKMRENDVLAVMSDHGFNSFRRGVNLNSWLHLNGYLHLKDGKAAGEWFKGVDWTKTKAFAIGLGGIFLNMKGREAKGIVEPGEQADALKKELMQKLSGLKDDETGEVGINALYDSALVYSGPYRDNAPDIIVGYNAGYRASWDSVTGTVTEVVFDDNTKSWSGDHCIDPSLVPGVFFSNRKMRGENVHMMDVAPTVLDVFGIPAPTYMDGTSLLTKSEAVPKTED